jgi:polyhydroxyalkanoate synthesis regulator phasin
MKQNKIPRNEYIRKPVGKTNPYKGDTIYTDMGQWEYPGQVTKIPSGDITMQGVPYPVYGQDNLGNSQMMYPGMDYQFPGQYVTEYPMVAYGGDPSLPNIEGHYPFGGIHSKTHTHMSEGGWLDELDDEYRRGGQRRKKRGTSKNIQSSINDVFRRNYDVFGPAGKQRFDPRARYEEGGWLDQYQEAGQLRAASTPAASAVSTLAPKVKTNPTGWEFVKEAWANRDQGPSDWNMMMMDKTGSYTDSGVDPFSLMLAAPQQVIKTATSAAKNLGNLVKESPIVKNKATEFIKETVKHAKKAHKWSKENIQDISNNLSHYLSDKEVQGEMITTIFYDDAPDYLTIKNKKDDTGEERSL